MRLNLDLVKLEYEKLREETIQAVQGQQNTLQWSMGAFGVVLGATLLLLSNNPGLSLPITILFGLYGVVMPVFVAMCSFAWFGELIRMERVGVYLRAVEAELATHLQGDGAEDDAVVPLRWETYLALHAKRAVGVGKQMIGYFGSVGIFSGAIGLSLAIAVWATWIPRETGLGSSRTIGPSTQWTLTGVAIGEFVLYMVVALYLIRGLSKASRAVAEIKDVFAPARAAVPAQR